MTLPSAVMATIDDPFRPMLSRKLVPIDLGRTISDHLFDAGYITTSIEGIKRQGFFYVTVNGKAVLQKDWNTIVGENDFMAVWTLPQGGGGGSNIGVILITVVMVAAAVFTGGATLGVALMWGAAAGAAMGLISTLIPQPEVPSSQTDREGASPTYSISAQGNSARLMEAIPVQYGRMRTFPAFAAQPYTENNSNQTYVYQLFCLGQGRLSIEALQIEDSNFSSYGEIEYEVVQPGGTVTLFPDNVVTSEAVQGLEMLGPNQVDYAVLGPFTTSPPGVNVNFIGIDIQLPQGAFTLDKKGNIHASTVAFFAQARLIDQSNNPVGDWIPLLSETLTFATQTAQMLSYKVPVPSARYQVRAARTTTWSSDPQVVNKLIWMGLRGYGVSARTYGNVTMLATVIKATNNLNSSTSRKINVISTRMLPTWDPVNGWGPEVPTKNPAWAYADALRNSDYGSGWGTDKINIVELYRLAQVWAARGDEFNGVFDSTITMWSALTQIAAVGRAMPVYYAGMMDIVRDEPKSIPAQIFTPANILENSFKTSYKLGTSQTPDHVVVEYYDDEVWQDTPVTAILPNSTKNNPYNLTLFGCTKGAQAWREGMYRAAVNRDQRGRYSFSTEMEGLLLQFGDLIHVSHDVPAWGQSGKVISLNRTTGKIVTTEPFNNFGLPVTYQIAFRKKNGRQDGPYTILPDPNQTPGVNSAIVSASPATLAAIFISDGVKTDLTQYVFGPSSRQTARLVVLAAKPNNKGEVALTCCDYVDSVHIADQGGDVPLPPPTSDLPGLIVGPIIGKVTLELTTTIGKQQIIATPAIGAVYYEFECKSEFGNWQAIGTSSDPFMFTYLSTGHWFARVRAIGAIPGPWATWEGDIIATSLPLPIISAFTATGEMMGIKLDWSVAPESLSIIQSVEIYRSDNNVLGNATRLIDLPFPAATYTHTGLSRGQRVFYWIRGIDTAGRIGPWFNNQEPITTTTINDPAILIDYLEDSIGRSQLTALLRAEIDSAAGSATEIAQIKTEMSAAISLRAQVKRPDGRIVTAGMAVGVTPNPAGELVSEAIFAVDRFALVRPGSLNSAISAPFIADGDDIFIRSLYVQKATITNALIGATLQSVATDNNGTPLTIINFQTGQVRIKGGAGVAGSLLDTTGLGVIAETGVQVVKVGQIA